MTPTGSMQEVWRQCLATRRITEVDETTPFTEERSNSCLNPTTRHNTDSGTYATPYWQFEEITTWLQVTLRLAHGALEAGQHVDEALNVIDRRWTIAAQHIDEYIHPAIEEQLQTIRQSALRIDKAFREAQKLHELRS